MKLEKKIGQKDTEIQTKDEQSRHLEKELRKLMDGVEQKSADDSEKSRMIQKLQSDKISDLESELSRIKKEAKENYGRMQQELESENSRLVQEVSFMTNQ